MNRGHGKTFFLRLLKKCLDPAVVEDPHTLELFQPFEQKTNQINEQQMYEQLKSGKLMHRREVSAFHKHLFTCRASFFGLFIDCKCYLGCVTPSLHFCYQ